MKKVKIKYTKQDFKNFEKLCLKNKVEKLREDYGFLQIFNQLKEIQNRVSSKYDEIIQGMDNKLDNS